ncbi:MAG: hypothetical protein JW909_08250 [Planctomycetes bacterium]|nr:hypothetical protein [Planctomycetota bacterium]
MAPGASSASPLSWHSPADPPFHLAGLPWFERERRFRRLPLKPVDLLPEAVDRLADSTAGAQVRFRTDSPAVSVKVRLLAPAGMVHMPATGQCGCDLYVGPAGSLRYYSTTKYDVKADSYEILMFEHSVRQVRNFTINLPLYQGISNISVGLSADASIDVPEPYASNRRVVIYGTSITQGGCASRPGMAYTNILSRLLNVEVVNLGFSGNGRGEPEVARTIAGIERPGLFVLDYEANCHDPERLATTLPEFIRILRAAHAGIPILVVSRIRFGHEHIQPADPAARLRLLDIQQSAVESFRKAGDADVHFFNGSVLLGDDYDECTVDSVHPNDLGFYRMARGLEPVIGELFF